MHEVLKSGFFDHAFSFHISLSLSLSLPLSFFLSPFILPKNENTERVEVGPRTLVLNGNESVVGDVRAFVVIPPLHFCRINNPVV